MLLNVCHNGLTLNHDKWSVYFTLWLLKKTIYMNIHVSTSSIFVQFITLKFIVQFFLWVFRGGWGGITVMI